MTMDNDELCNAPSAGMSDEPSYTTPRGYPICERCGLSTRNFNELVCAPCRKNTRLILNKGDRKWLRQIKIKTNSAPAPPHVDGTICHCGSGMEARIIGRCAECATTDDMNAYLFVRGMRPCPHSEHSSDEDFAACMTTDEMNTFLKQRG